MVRLSMLLLMAGTSEVLAANFLFPNGTLGSNAQSIPQVCQDALLATVNCNGAISEVLSNNTSLSGASRDALCSATCSASLGSYVAGTSKACAHNQTLNGIAVVALGGLAYSNFNRTCQKDSKSGQYCTDFLQSFAISGDQEGTTLSKDIICSECVANLFIGLQGSEYSLYDATYADQWTSIQQQCGFKYNTTIPVSPFPAIPPAQPNVTLACPKEQQYMVQSGDNCNAIAQKYNVASRQIVAVNSLATDCSNLIAGAPICIPPIACTTYSVNPGDSCSSIVDAKKVSSISRFLSINPGLYCQTLLAYEIVCVSPPGGEFNGTVIPGATATQTAIYATATAKPPSTVPFGTTMQCGKWYQVKEFDTCQLIIVGAAISLDLFLEINTSVNKNCTNLQIDFSYCTSPTADWRSSTGGGSSTTVAPPGPTASGTTGSCYAWYTISSGDTCSKVQTQFGISMAQLQQWNTGLKSDCSNLLLDVAYCVKGPSTGAKRDAPQLAAPVRERGGYPIGYPYPIRS